MTRVRRSSLREDWHVHSTFSDGDGSLEQNVEAARGRGLTHLGFVDHVRASTDWVPGFVDAVGSLRSRLAPGITISAGIEAKLLDSDGTLDLPDRADLTGVDRIVIADHSIPSPDGPIAPGEVADAIAGGELAATEAAGWVVSATTAAMRRHPGSQVAHLFSVLPKAGLATADLPSAALRELVDAASDSGCLIEVNERWRAPSVGVARVFALCDVRLVASSDAHSPDAIGDYAHVTDVLNRTSVPNGAMSAGRAA